MKYSIFWLLIFFISAPSEVFALASCGVTASPVAFGAYNPLDVTPHDGAGNLQVSCSLLGLLSLGINYTILLSAGSARSFTPRTMVNGTHPLNYNLYTSETRDPGSIWGDGTAGSTMVSDGYLLGLLTTTRNYWVLSRIPALQNVINGTFSDVLIVTLNY